MLDWKFEFNNEDFSAKYSLGIEEQIQHSLSVMRDMEEELTRNAVVAYLRGIGWTVQPPKENDE